MRFIIMKILALKREKYFSSFRTSKKKFFIISQKRRKDNILHVLKIIFVFRGVHATRKGGKWKQEGRIIFELEFELWNDY